MSIEIPTKTNEQKPSKTEGESSLEQKEKELEIKKLELEIWKEEQKQDSGAKKEKDEKSKKTIRQAIKSEGVEKITEKQAKELVESLEGGVFLGTKEIQEVFSGLLADKIEEKSLPRPEEIQKTAETFKELGYTKWALVRLISKDKKGSLINIGWLNKHFKTDPKNPEVQLIKQGERLDSLKQDDIKLASKIIEDKWAIVALECEERSATTDKTKEQQDNLVEQVSQDKGLEFYTPEAGEDLYAYLAARLKTGEKLRQETWLRTASFANLGSVMNGHADADGIRIESHLLTHKLLSAGRALAYEAKEKE